MLGLLWRANHEIETLSKRMIRALGVTGPQRMVLRIIAGKPGISAGGISDTARIDASTLTGMLERLARGSFLVRSRDHEDGRRARFLVTPAGQRVADARKGTVESALVASLSALSAEERAAVRRWLTAFGDSLLAAQSELSDQGSSGP